ncbi:hypothetical protein F4820DRAFT_452744 [Hypoxylon rubiginosum]|uniref:Uncharacterized protein n=1 Tax=Hypoxylon rubiginosum TaxID=110542 RepID=A0ACB9YN74_9PEZI|nr:hypothetical protein F4820DRAFT_452744 [Hypoxylon rubiginosum]
MSTVGGDRSSEVASSTQPSKTHIESPVPEPEQSRTDPDVNEEEDGLSLMPKYMLPQNDPAYAELLNRDHSDLVSRAEVMAIFRKQPSRAYSKEEIRARYSAFFPVRDMMAAWKRGDMEYDPDAADKQTDEKGKGDGQE